LISVSSQIVMLLMRLLHLQLVCVFVLVILMLKDEWRWLIHFITPSFRFVSFLNVSSCQCLF